MGTTETALIEFAWTPRVPHRIALGNAREPAVRSAARSPRRSSSPGYTRTTDSQRPASIQIQVTRLQLRRAEALPETLGAVSAVRRQPSFVALPREKPRPIDVLLVSHTAPLPPRTFPQTTPFNQPILEIVRISYPPKRDPAPPTNVILRASNVACLPIKRGRAQMGNTRKAMEPIPPKTENTAGKFASGKPKETTKYARNNAGEASTCTRLPMEY